MIRFWRSKEAKAEPQALKSKARRLLRISWFVTSWGVAIAVVLALVAVLGIIIVPRALGWHGVVILSGSMEPELKTGGIAFVQPATADEIAVGDILTFKRAGSRNTLISHRVVGIAETPEGRAFTTKGDANTNTDQALVSPDQVVGKVTFDVPYLGRVVEKLRSRDNYYIFIGIPAALLILNEIWTVITEYRLQRQKRQAETATTAGTEGAPS